MTENKSLSKQEVIKKGVKNLVIYMLLSSTTLLLPYGSLVWPKAWLLLVLWLAYFIILLTWGMRYNPDLIAERASSMDKEKEFQPWDKFIVPMYLLTSLVLNIISGLDAGRFGWSAVPEVVQWIALPFVLSTYILPLWVMMSNPFASGVARIQEERGHRTITGGPYRFVRHPMYTSSLIYGLFFPLFLGSWWALIPGAIVWVLMITRTALEDRMLQNELEGYIEFTQQTRYRLLPGLW
jgi:protein-S-isoprenylcysteine O-methyltransferase Ste14